MFSIMSRRVGVPGWDTFMFSRRRPRHPSASASLLPEAPLPSTDLPTEFAQSWLYLSPLLSPLPPDLPLLAGRSKISARSPKAWGAFFSWLGLSILQILAKALVSILVSCAVSGVYCLRIASSLSAAWPLMYTPAKSCRACCNCCQLAVISLLASERMVLASVFCPCSV